MSTARQELVGEANTIKPALVNLVLALTKAETDIAKNTSFRAQGSQGSPELQLIQGMNQVKTTVYQVLTGLETLKDLL